MLKKLLKSGLCWSWIVFLVVALDYYSKSSVVQMLTPYEPFQVLSFLNFTLAHNTGAAFSLLHSASGWQNVFFVSLALIVCVVMFGWLAQLSSRNRWLSIAICLIVGGALGNVWDRIKYGYVIDFFDFHLGTWHFAIFNVADSAICIGAFMIILCWTTKRFCPCS